MKIEFDSLLDLVVLLMAYSSLTFRLERAHNILLWIVIHPKNLPESNASFHSERSGSLVEVQGRAMPA